MDVYQRAAAGARFSKIATLESPGNARSSAPTQPLTLAFDRSSSMHSFLATVWSDPDGVTMIVSAFTVSQGSVTKQWVSKRSCPATSPGFNYVMQPGLAISRGGEAVAVGSWGCGAGAVGGEIILLKGRGGDGEKAYVNSTVSGQIWAVDVDVDHDRSNNDVAYLVAGSWSVEKGSLAQISTWQVNL